MIFQQRAKVVLPALNLFIASRMTPKAAWHHLPVRSPTFNLFWHGLFPWLVTPTRVLPRPGARSSSTDKTHHYSDRCFLRSTTGIDSPTNYRTGPGQTSVGSGQLIWRSREARNSLTVDHVYPERLSTSLDTREDHDLQTCLLATTRRHAPVGCRIVVDTRYQVLIPPKSARSQLPGPYAISSFRTSSAPSVSTLSDSSCSSITTNGKENISKAHTNINPSLGSSLARKDDDPQRGVLQALLNLP